MTPFSRRGALYAALLSKTTHAEALAAIARKTRTSGRATARVMDEGGEVFVRTIIDQRSDGTCARDARANDAGRGAYHYLSRGAQPP